MKQQSYEQIDLIADLERKQADDEATIPFEIDWIENMAINAACEAIQVAAMCRKYRESLIEKGKAK